MKTVQSLTIAAAAVLSLGIGTAMADGPSTPSDYWGERNLEAITRQAVPQPVSNSISGFHSYWLHATPMHADGGTVGGDGAGG